MAALAQFKMILCSRGTTSDGIVKMVSNSGAQVSSLTQAECSENYQIRERLEPLLLRSSMPNLTAEALARMETLVGEMKVTTDMEMFLRLHREFHWISCSGASANSLSDVSERLWNSTQPYRRVFMRIVGVSGLGVTYL